MRRPLALVLLLLGFSAAAYTQPQKFMVRNLPLEPAGNIIFRFLTSATGAPTFGDVCTTHASDISTGATNWFCLRGDGTSTASTGYELSAVGTPTLSTPKHCANGLDCSAAAHAKTSVGNYYRTLSVASPAGSFSVFAMIEKDATAQQEIITKFGGAGKRGFNFDHTTGTAQLVVYKSDASSSTRGTAVNAVPIRGPAFVVFTYEYVTDGTSIITPYVNGTASSTALTTAVGPIQAGSERIDVGDQESDDARVFTGTFHLAGYTEKVLDATTIAAMSKTALGQLTGTAGEVVTNVRGTTESVADSAGTFMGWVGINVPAVGANGVASFLGTTNKLLRVEELENAAWTATLSSVVADSAAAPDGPTTMDTVTTSNNLGAVTQNVTVTSSAGPWTLSAFTRSTSGTTTASFGMTCGAGNAATCSCINPYTGATCPTATATTICYGTPTATTTPTRWALTMTCSSATVLITPLFTGGEYSVATGSQIWGDVKFETGAIATPYIIATSATATSSPDVNNLPNPTLLNVTRGCSKVVFTPRFTGLVTTNSAILTLGAGSKWLAYKNASGTNGQTQAHDGTHQPLFDNTWTAGSAETIRTTWGYGSLGIFNDADGFANSTAFSTFGSVGTSVYLGAISAGTVQANGVVGAISIGDGRKVCSQ